MFAKKLVVERGRNVVKRCNNLFNSISVSLSNYLRTTKWVSYTVTLCNHFNQFKGLRGEFTALWFVMILLLWQ